MSIRRIAGELKDNGSGSEIVELGLINEAADVAEALITGRYPEKGFSLNRASDMLVYVLSGSGAVVYQKSGFELHTNQVVSIDKGTPYYFEGNALRILMICSPAWTAEQYEQVILE